MRHYYWREDERRTMVECGYDQTKPDLSSKRVFNQFGKFFHGIFSLNSTIAKSFVNRRRIFNHLYHALYYLEPSFSSPSLSTFHVRSKPHGDPVKRAYLQGSNSPSSTTSTPASLFSCKPLTQPLHYVGCLYLCCMLKHALRISLPLSYSLASLNISHASCNRSLNRPYREK